MKELYVKKGDNEYEKVEFKDLLSLQFDYDGDGVLLITEENYLRLKMAIMKKPRNITSKTLI